MDEPTEKYFDDNKDTKKSKLIYYMVKKTIEQVPHDVAVKQLDRFLETLQILTSCQFGN